MPVYDDQVLEQQHGGLLCLAQCLARRAREARPPGRTDELVVQLTADLRKLPHPLTCNAVFMG